MSSSPAKREVRALLYQGKLHCVQAGLGLAGFRSLVSLISQPIRTKADALARLEKGSLRLSRETCTDSLKLCKACRDPVTHCRREKPFPRDVADVPVLPPTTASSQQYGAQHHARVHTEGKTPTFQSRRCHMLVPIHWCYFLTKLSHNPLAFPSASLTQTSRPQGSIVLKQCLTFLASAQRPALSWKQLQLGNPLPASCASLGHRKQTESFP